MRSRISLLRHASFYLWCGPTTRVVTRCGWTWRVRRLANWSGGTPLREWKRIASKRTSGYRFPGIGTPIRRCGCDNAEQGGCLDFLLSCAAPWLGALMSGWFSFPWEQPGNTAGDVQEDDPTILILPVYMGVNFCLLVFKKNLYASFFQESEVWWNYYWCHICSKWWKFAR